jgi:HEPN domain-containing protein
MVNDITREWLIYATSDLAAANSLPGDRSQYRNVAYHCQQAAEKALKGYLVHNNIKFDRTHDLFALLSECALLDVSFGGARLMNHCANLNPFSVSVRYPGSVVKADYAAVKKNLNSAARILEFVCAKLGFMYKI